MCLSSSSSAFSAPTQEHALYDVAMRAHSWYMIGPEGPPTDDFVADAQRALVEPPPLEPPPCMTDETSLACFYRLLTMLERDLARPAEPTRPETEARALQLQVLSIIAMMELSLW